MANPDASAVLARDLGNLPFKLPDGSYSIVSIPGFDKAALNHPEIGEAHGQLALRVSTAIVEDLEINGFTVIANSKLDALVDAKVAEARNPQVIVHCQRCRGQVFAIDTSGPEVNTDINALARGLQTHTAVCR